MEFLLLVPVIGLVAIYVAYREWLNAAHKHWQAELDLFKKRLAAYEELKRAVAPLAAQGSVSQSDTERFARAMESMQFLFDKDVETFVSGLYSALVKKHTLDLLLEKTAGRVQTDEDKALTEFARRRSRELGRTVAEGVYQNMPKRMEKFMHPRPAA